MYRPERQPRRFKSSPCICPLMVMSRPAGFDISAWLHLLPGAISILRNLGSTMKGTSSRKLKHFLIEGVNKGLQKTLFKRIFCGKFQKKNPQKRCSLNGTSCRRLTRTTRSQLGYYNSDHSLIVTIKCFYNVSLSLWLCFFIGRPSNATTLVKVFEAIGQKTVVEWQMTV